MRTLACFAFAAALALPAVAQTTTPASAEPPARGAARSNEVYTGSYGDVVLNGASPNGVILRATDATNHPSILLQTATDTGSGVSIVNYSWIPLLSVLSNGNVGLGINNPSADFYVAKNRVGGVTAVIDNYDATANVNSFSGLYFKQNGAQRAFLGSLNTGNTVATGGPGAVQLWNFADNAPIIFGTSATEKVRITNAGRVGIGTNAPTEALDVAGNINVSGNINAKYQDVAEWVPSAADLTAGTVVIVDPKSPNGVAMSSRPYDTAVAGVISDKPGVLLGEGGAGREKVATTGRVKVHVDATAHPIALGDLLVTGTRPGTAMKSIPVNVNGFELHRPGTIVGKALEPLASGEGDILVLLTLQ